MRTIKASKLLKKLSKSVPLAKNEWGVPNQYVIKGDGWELFQSYNSPIALLLHGQVYIFPHWKYSNTTGRYRNAFLGETKAETEKKLKSGEYIYVVD